MIEWGKNLRARGKELGLSEADVARRSGLEPRTYSNYINQNRQPDFESLMRICGTLRLTPNEVFGIDDMAALELADARAIARPPHLPDSYVGVATLEVRPAMGGPNVVDDYEPESLTFYPAEFIRALRVEPEMLRLLDVEGPSMSPVLENGDKVLVNVAHTNPSQPGIFVLWDGFGLVCKWVERITKSDPPRVRISSENPRFQPYEATVGDPDDGAEATIIGRVIWFARQI